MNTIQELLKSKRKEKNLSLRDASKLVGISHSYLSTLEKGMDPRTNTPINPTPETLKLISKAYDISYNELMKLSGYIEETEKNCIDEKLTPKQQKDISKEMDQLIKYLEEEPNILFNGDPMSPESIESVIDAIEFCKKQAKVLNKKFTPKKYRKDES